MKATVEYGGLFDHLTILLEIVHEEFKMPSPFKFNLVLLQDEGYCNLIQ